MLLKIFSLDCNGVSVFIGNDNAFTKFSFALKEFPLRLLNIFSNAFK